MSFLRPISPPRAMSRSESPCRIRTRTWRYSNNSNLRLAMDAPFKKNGAYRLGKFEPHLYSGATGAYVPTLRWLQYADLELAPMRRPSGGAITPTLEWLHIAAP
ncbi:hypothetical protein DF050_39420 [Burkholderia cepacia]|nr:hypothetical protein DF050_39420 [Burkholderia cepacia]